jgi:hypothetical protein
MEITGYVVWSKGLEPPHPWWYMHLKHAPAANSATTAYINLVPTGWHNYIKPKRLPVNARARRLHVEPTLGVVVALQNEVRYC